MATKAKGTARDKQDKSFVQSLTRTNGTAQEVLAGNTSDSPVITTHNVKWDSLQATFPDSNTDVWTYSLNSVLVMRVTIVYTNNNKHTILSVNKELL